MSERAEALFLGYLRERALEPGADFDALCAQHAELAEELRWLHERHEQADAMLRALRGNGGDEGPDDHAVNGRYDVLGELARGGMSRILEVWDRDLRRKLVMKLPMGSESGSPVPGQSPRSSRGVRLLREAHVLGQIEHPGIVPVHETGEDRVGRPFFTMRRVRGRHFGEVIALVHEGRDGWTLARAVSVLQRVCEAVAYAHSRGVVHRDLKPSNVMVGPFGETYVVDWGLAKVLGGAVLGEGPRSQSLAGESASALSPALTMEGDVVGTPAYMPPEQAEHGGEVTTAADVYAVGAMLYHLLTGAAPFGDEPESSTPMEILAAVRRRAPRAIRQVARRSPIELVAVCEKAMQRDPSRRYASMLELAEDLRAYTEGRVVRAHRTGAFVELRKWMGRNRLAASALILAIGTLVVGVVFERSSAAALEKANEELDASNTGLLETQSELEQLIYFNEVALASAALETDNAAEAKRRLEACPEELRQWEWHWLKRRVDTADLVFQAQEMGVIAQFSPGGSRVATYSGDSTVALWDAASGERLRMLAPAPPELYMDVRWSPDEERLAVFQHHDRRQDLQIFSVETGELERVLDPHRARIRDAGWSPDGRWLASVSSREIVLFDGETLEEARRIPIGFDAGQLEFLADGSALAIGGGDGRLRVIDPESGEAWGRFGANVAGLQAHTNEPWVATILRDSSLAVWDVASGERIDALSSTRARSGAMAFHPWEPWVAVGRGTAVEIVDTTNELLILRLVGHDHTIISVDFSHDGRRLVSSDTGGLVRLWDLERLDHLPPSVLPAEVFRLAIHPERPIAACAFRDGSVGLWRRGEDLPFQTLHVQGDVYAMNFAVDQPWLAAGGSSGRAIVWDWQTGEAVLEFSLDAPGRAAIRPDGEYVTGLTTSSFVLVRTWSVPEGELLDSFKQPTFSGLRGLAYSPDGRMLGVGDDGGIIWLLDAESGAELGRVELPQRIADVFSFSPEAGRIATQNGLGPWAWGRDRLVVHQVDPPRMLWQTRDQEGVAAPQWTGDGARILTASRSGLLNVWDADSGRRIVAVGLGEERTRGDRSRPGYSFAVNRDGSLIVTVSMDDQTLRWHDAGPVEPGPAGPSTR